MNLATFLVMYVDDTADGRTTTIAYVDAPSEEAAVNIALSWGVEDAQCMDLASPWILQCERAEARRYYADLVDELG